MEKQMREIYTKEIFLRFQDEVVKSTAYLKCDIIRENDNQCVYTILRAVIEEQSWKVRQIVYDKILVLQSAIVVVLRLKELCVDILFSYTEVLILCIAN
jgi:hypothetical protein